MPTYLVERYVGAADVEAASASIALHAAGVSHLATTYVPEDETCFDLFLAPSRDVLRSALRRAAIAYERIGEAHDHRKEELR
jgi:hypothetical protein